jgi:holo-[acyl-carrier protein] synthase
MPVRIGLDLVAVNSVADTLRGEHGEHYLERVYTEREVDDCRGPSGQVEPERLAARFAAKEAAIKAIPGCEEGVSLTDIEVRRSDSGCVELALSGRVAGLAESAGLGELALSITHEAGFAAAAVIAT